VKNSKFWLLSVIVALAVAFLLECRQQRVIAMRDRAKLTRDSLVIDSLKSYYQADTLNFVEHAAIPDSN
jgi:hypothetical protein